MKGITKALGNAGTYIHIYVYIYVCIGNVGQVESSWNMRWKPVCMGGLYSLTG